MDADQAILVTGGAGFVGSHSVRALLQQGTAVHVLDNLSTGSATNLPAGAVLLEADLRSEHDMQQVFTSNRYAAVVHCAAQTSVARSMAEPELDYDVNVSGTRRLTALARLQGVARFVFISSGGAIYGETSSPAREESPAAPLSYYGRHKLAAEAVVREAGLSHAILRPANIYGPGQRSDLEGGVIAVFMERILAGETLTVHGDGAQSRDFVHVGDTVRAIQAALSSSEDVTWNVASGVSTTVMQLVSLLRELTERPVDLRFSAPRPGDVRHSLLSPERLMAAGWCEPLNLREGLRQLVEAQRQGAAKGELALKLLRATPRIIRQQPAG